MRSLRCEKISNSNWSLQANKDGGQDKVGDLLRSGRHLQHSCAKGRGGGNNKEMLTQTSYLKTLICADKESSSAHLVSSTRLRRFGR